MEKYKCKLCKHEWLPRKDKQPVACPKCKRYDYMGKIKTRKESK